MRLALALALMATPAKMDVMDGESFAFSVFFNGY